MVINNENGQSAVFYPTLLQPDIYHGPLFSQSKYLMSYFVPFINKKSEFRSICNSSPLVLHSSASIRNNAGYV